MTDEQIQLPFTGVLDESTDPRHLAPGSLVSATNCVFDQDGQLQVRYGYTMLNNPPSSVYRLAVFAFELVLISLSGGCYSYSTNDAAFIQRDTSTPLAATHFPLSNATSSYQSWGSVNLGYRVTAWIDTIDNCPRAALYDVATGSLVSVTKLSSQASVNVYVGGIGTTAIVVASDSGAANIRAYTAQLSPVGAWSGGTIISDGNYSSTVGTYGADFGGTTFVIAYEQIAGGNSSLRVRSFNSALALQANVSNALAAGNNTFAAVSARLLTGENLWIGYYASVVGAGSNLKYQRCDPSTLVASATQDIGISGQLTSSFYSLSFERISGTQMIVSFSDNRDTWYGQYTSAGIVGSLSHVFNAVCVTAPEATVDAQGNVITMQMLADIPNDGTSPASYYLVDLQSAQTIASTPQLIAVLSPTLVNRPSVPPGNITQYTMPTWSRSNSSARREAALPIVRAGAGRQGLELFVTDNAAPGRYQAAQLGKELYLGGSYYDGRTLAEIGFPQWPIVSASNGGGAGSTYQYRQTWVRVDQQGNTEESAPSQATQVTSGAIPNVNLTITTTGITNKQHFPDTGTGSRIYAAIYRTPALASGDTTFYLVTKQPYPSALADNEGTPSLSFNDTLSDASLTDGTHPVLYTVTGELIHNVPETFFDITSHNLRLWGIGADQRTIWYSSQYVDGVLPFFNNTFQLTVDDAGEPLTCLASLYDKLLIFTRSKAYVVYGDGPSPAGTGNDLTTPKRIPSAAGCIDPRSIVETPQGVFFQSQRGLELIDTALGVTFIGQPVSTTTSTYPTCTSAAMAESDSVIRWTFTQVDGIPANSGQSGAIVNYDMRRGRWAVHRITWNSKGAGFYAPMQAGAVHPTLGYVAANNDTSPNAPNVYRENTKADANAWTDFNTFFVPVTLTTAWIKAQDLQGWQSIRRIRVLANYYDHHDLSIQLAYDYQGIADSYSFADATIQGFRSGSWEQVQVAPGTGRRCEAVQVTLATNSLSGFATGRGAGFVGLAFEVRPQKGGFRNIPIAARS